jgi:hypothetical protein
MTKPPTLADLIADPGELEVSCLDCHHNTTMPVATLLPRYAAETPFPVVGLTTGCGARRGFPGGDGVVREPHGQTAPPAQRLVIFCPIRYAPLRPRNMVAAATLALCGMTGKSEGRDRPLPTASRTSVQHAGKRRSPTAPRFMQQSL